MNKLHLIWIPGIILGLVMILIPWLAQKNCTQNIGCLLFTVIPLYPAVALKIKNYILSIFISFIFWFLLGSLIGFLVYKIKK